MHGHTTEATAAETKSGIKVTAAVLFVQSFKRKLD